jgi:sialic acid synthase SpsE
MLLNPDPTSPTCIIAEIGVNHDGQFERAGELIQAAAEAGADAVKFQYFQPDRLLADEAMLAGYQSGHAEDAAGLLKKLTLTIKQLQRLRSVAKQCGVVFLVTPFSLEDVEDLRPIGLDAVKISSPDAVNPLLLDAAMGLGLPMLISTGTCDLEDLSGAAEAARRTGGALLQCVSSYPTPTQHASLGGIRAIADRYAVPAGYSDHTADLDTGALAVAAGAVVLEKHLTHDRDAPGPDHAASLEPDQFKEYVAYVRRAESMIGRDEKRCLDIEKDVRGVSRQSLCLKRDLAAGSKIQASDLTTKRPAKGIPAGRWAEVIGRLVTRDIPAGQLIRDEDLA